MWTCLCGRVVSIALHTGVHNLPVKVKVIPLSCQETPSLLFNAHVSEIVLFVSGANTVSSIDY